MKLLSDMLRAVSEADAINSLVNSRWLLSQSALTQIKAEVEPLPGEPPYNAAEETLFSLPVEMISHPHVHGWLLVQDYVSLQP